MQQPTTFQPDFDEEEGPFDIEEQANARMKELLVEQSYRGFQRTCRNEIEFNPGQRVRLSEWRSNVCSALTKQTAKNTCGLPVR